jgi:aspartate/methionine/tyrosine aminotransferase
MKDYALRNSSFLPSAFGEMTLLAAQHGAVNLGQGFPDFAPPDFVLASAQEAFKGKLHQYAPPRGHARLQQALARTLEPQLGFAPDPTLEVTIHCGATQALHATMQALLEPGDEVIVLEPQFDTYTPQVLLAGGVPVYVPLHPGETTWELDFQELRAACSSRTKLMLLNTPHNPTGKVFNRFELEQIAEIALEFDFYVIADEVYDRLVFGVDHISFACLPGMQERTITIGSAGKMFSVTGWRIGWTISSAAIASAIRAGLQWTTFAAATPVQEAVALCLERMNAVGYEQDFRLSFLKKRDLLCSALEGAGFKIWQPEGAYYIVADASRFTNDAAAFSKRMVTEFKLAAMPMSVFYSAGTRATAIAGFRFAFCKSEKTLTQALVQLELIRSAHR